MNGYFALPDTPRAQRWTVVVATAAAVAGLALTLTVHEDFALLAGVAAAVAALMAAVRRDAPTWFQLLVCVLGLAGTFLLATAGHDLVLHAFGRTERCQVIRTEEHQHAKYPEVDYVLGCPSGEIELSTPWDYRLTTSDADVLLLPPLRPIFPYPDA